MNLNYVLLPEDYLPQPLPADTANDDAMDVDQVPMGEPMEVDVVEVRPKRRVIRVRGYVVVSAGEPMEVDPVPAQPQPNVDVADNAAAQPWPVLPRPAWYVDAADYAPAQPWPVLPRPAWNIDMADFAKYSAALIVGGTRVSRRSPRKVSPRKTTAPHRSAPSSPPMAKPVVSAHPYIDMSKIATSSKVKVEDMPLFFGSVEITNVERQIKGKEPEVRCIRKTRFSSPLSPVKQSKMDHNLFVTSNRQSPDLITDNRWLKTSRTPGRNIHNESVFEGCSGADYSQLAVAYPPTHDRDILFPEIKRFSPVRPAKMDEDFFLKSNGQTPDLAANNRWLKISRTPDYNIHNEPTTVEDDEADYSSLCMGYPPSEDTEGSLPEIDFSEADTSLNWAPENLTPETPRRIRQAKLFSPVSPVRQSKLDDDLFITSKRQSPGLGTNNGWLKTSRTPGRNIHNESVFFDNEYADYSYLALAYPSVEDSDTSFNEDYSSTSPSIFLASCTSGYLADDSFSFIATPLSSSSSLAGDDSFGYLADVSSSSFTDISEISYASYASMADDQTSYSSCETVSEAAPQTDLSMDLLIATMSNLVIDEDSDMEEEIADESAADNERTISDDSVAWKTAEETAPRDDFGGVVDEVMESFWEEGSEVTQSGSTDEDSFDSHYPSSLSSGNEGSCTCNSYTHSSHVNSSGINLSVSRGSAGSGTENELLEEFDLLAVEEFQWEYDDPEEAYEEEEDEPGNGNRPLAELASSAEVNDEDQELLAHHDLFEHGNETELDVNKLEDDLKYIYTLPY